MNNKRLDYTIGSNFLKPRITGQWLLGFVEGEGSFNINKSANYMVVFNITQSSRDLPLMKEIKAFLLKLPGVKDDVIYLYNKSSTSCSSLDWVNLSIQHSGFIKNVIIPLFDSMVWYTKKSLDYQDWKNILRLKYSGHHFSEKGIKLIDQTLNQMNNKRLSTNRQGMLAVDRTKLLADTNKLLSGPSNLLVNKGRMGTSVNLQDEKGIMFKSFDSIRNCAKFLGVDPKTVNRRLESNKGVLIDNKQYFIKKVTEEDETIVKKNSECVTLLPNK